MPITRKIAFLCYAINALVSAGFGLTYLVRDEFMPYHAAALQVEWGALDSSLQVLLLALMRVAGAGWIALSISILALLFFAFPRGSAWVRITLPMLLLSFYIPTLWATLSVTWATGADVPWYGNAMAVFSTLLAIMCDASAGRVGPEGRNQK